MKESQVKPNEAFEIAREEWSAEFDAKVIRHKRLATSDSLYENQLAEEERQLAAREKEAICLLLKLMKLTDANKWCQVMPSDAKKSECFECFECFF